MRKGLIIPLLLVVFAMVVMVFLYNKSKTIDVSQHDHVIELVRTLKQSNASLNKDIYKVYAGVGRNYDGVSVSVLVLRNTLDRLASGEAGLADIEDLAFTEALDTLQESVLRKTQLIEAFKLRHAILKNSLDYFPVIIERVQNSELYLDDREHILSLIRSVLYIAINGDQTWLNTARREYVYLEERYPDEMMRHLLEHTWLIIDGSQKLHKIFLEESQATLEVDIDALHYAYMNHYKHTIGGADQYRILMSVIIMLLLGLIIYLFVLINRNAIKQFREQERAAVTLNSINDTVVVTNKNGIIEFMNPVAERMTGFESGQAEGKPLTQVIRLFDDSSRETFDEKITDAIGQDSPVLFKEPMLLQSDDGSESAVEAVVAPLHDQTNDVAGSLVVLHDVTQTQRMARKLEWQASHDALTGLVNRREFEHRVNEALITAHQDRATHALMYMDLDQFKVVNDTCGHIAGDDLLCQVTEQLKSVLRAGDILARLGGDEFGVLLTYCPEKNAEDVAEKLLRAMQEFSFDWEGNAFKIGVSIGLVPVTEYSEDITSLLSAADVACYAAKDSGRNRVHFYQANDEEMVKRQAEMHWVARLNDALENDQFVLFSQAIKPIQSEKEAKPYREVLVRMLGEDGSTIPPGAFLPAAERYNLIGKMDRWVIDHSFKFYAETKEKIGNGIRLSINLSGNSVGDETLHDFIDEKLKQYSVVPEDITFEITETSAITNLNQAIKMINELRPLGCRFALDDFGAGLSSFGYLKNLPIDVLKIDGKFVKDIETDKVYRAMVEMITHVGKVMGIQVVAEFVENEQIIDILQEIGVDYAQGYGIDVPHLLSEADVV